MHVALPLWPSPCTQELVQLGWLCLWMRCLWYQDLFTCPFGAAQQCCGKQYDENMIRSACFRGSHGQFVISHNGCLVCTISIDTASCSKVLCGHPPGEAAAQLPATLILRERGPEADRQPDAAEALAGADAALFVFDSRSAPSLRAAVEQLLGAARAAQDRLPCLLLAAKDDLGMSPVRSLHTKGYI